VKPRNVKLSDWLKYNVLFFIEHFTGHKTYQKLFGKAEKRLFASVDKYAAAHQPKHQFEILDYKKGEWKEPLYGNYFPKVFRGAVTDWECSKNWSMEFFANKFGEDEVTLIDNPGLVGSSDQANDKIKLKEYIEMLKKGTSKYLKFSRFVQNNSTLRADIDYTWLRKFRSKFSFGDMTYLFIGGKGTSTPVHNGFSRTIFVQVKGSKKWVFYAPEDRIFIGARPERMNYFYTDADPYNLNDPKFPLLKHAKRFEVVVNEGDVIYIPPLVWHQVENVTDTIGFAYKFADLGSSFSSTKMLATLFFLSTKPLVFQTSAHFKNQDDTYGNG
jgi:hypothetical protein